MERHLLILSLFTILSSCKAEGPGQQKVPPPTTPTTQVSGSDDDVLKTAMDVGVQPGRVEPSRDDQPLAVVIDGDNLEFRRAGEELWSSIAEDTVLLWAGDQLRSGSGATLALADDSVIETAPDAAIVVGDAVASTDLGQRVGVLYGVVRVTVSPRAAGEGPLVVHLGELDVEMINGTTVVGLSAAGTARIEVETGTPMTSMAGGDQALSALKAGDIVDIDGAGKTVVAASPGEWTWGQWIDQQESATTGAEMVAAQATLLGTRRQSMDTEWESLGTLFGDINKADKELAASLAKNDTTGYPKSAELLGGKAAQANDIAARIEQLSTAMLSNTYIASELRRRHPEAEKAYADMELEGFRAVLYHQRQHLVQFSHVRPVRAHVYMHTAQGRSQAAALSFDLPPVLAKLKLGKAIAVPKSSAKRRVLWSGPVVDWHSAANAAPAPHEGPWFVATDAPQGSGISNLEAKDEIEAMFPGGARQMRGRWAVRIAGMRDGAVVAGAGSGSVPELAQESHGPRGKSRLRVAPGGPVPTKAAKPAAPPPTAP